MGKLYFNGALGGSSENLTGFNLRLIEGSRRYLKLGNFDFDDAQVQRALESAAGRGVAIFVLTNLQLDDREGGKAQTQVNLNALHYQSGAHVNSLDGLHAKYLVADGVRGLVMSCNYKYNSLRRNPEAGISVDGAALLDLERVFDALFMHADNIDFHSAEGLNRTTRTQAALFDADLSLTGRLKATICCSADKQDALALCHVTTLLEAILNIIDSAKERLDIVAWSYRSVEKLCVGDRSLLSSLEAAIKRGVRCRIMGSKQSTDKTIQLCGVTIVRHEYNHAKFVLSDNGGLLFTANIDGQHGLVNGFELGVELDAAQRAAAQGFVDELFQHSKA